MIRCLSCWSKHGPFPLSSPFATGHPGRCRVPNSRVRSSTTRPMGPSPVTGFKLPAWEFSHGKTHGKTYFQWIDDGKLLQFTNLNLVGGLKPSEKYESQLGWLFPIYGKIQNVPNHQPAKNVQSWKVHRRCFFSGKMIYKMLGITRSNSASMEPFVKHWIFQGATLEL